MPLLIIGGIAFKVVRVGLAFVLKLFGFELVWPPTTALDDTAGIIADETN